LKNVEGIGHATFSAEDVIRHELVARIVAAYDKADASRRARSQRLSKAGTVKIEVIVRSALWKRRGPQNRS